MVKPRRHQILYKDEGNGAAVYDFYVGRSLTAHNLLSLVHNRLRQVKNETFLLAWSVDSK